MRFDIRNGNYYRVQSVPSRTCEMKKGGSPEKLNDEEKIKEKKTYKYSLALCRYEQDRILHADILIREESASQSP